MTAERHFRNLALVGFMGVGKTTVGRMIARQLGLRFVDIDEAIESKAGRAITRIFEEDGEAAFRRLERDMGSTLIAGKDQIISTGGGFVCQPGNMDLLKSGSLVVCLWASPDTIWNRVHHQTHRPLLRVENPRAEIERLLALRAPYYRESDVLVNSGLRSLREVATQVCHHFVEARRRGPSE